MYNQYIENIHFVSIFWIFSTVVRADQCSGNVVYFVIIYAKFKKNCTSILVATMSSINYFSFSFPKIKYKSKPIIHIPRDEYKLIFSNFRTIYNSIGTQMIGNAIYFQQIMYAMMEFKPLVTTNSWNNYFYKLELVQSIY